MYFAILSTRPLFRRRSTPGYKDLNKHIADKDGEREEKGREYFTHWLRERAMAMPLRRTTQNGTGVAKNLNMARTAMPQLCWIRYDKGQIGPTHQALKEIGCG